MTETFYSVLMTISGSNIQIRICFIKIVYNPYMARVIGRFKNEKSYLRAYTDAPEVANYNAIPANRKNFSTDTQSICVFLGLR